MSQLINKTARTFSLFGNPLISVPLVLGLVLIETEGFESGLRVLSLILILIVFPITAWLIIKTKSGTYTDSDVSDKGQRIYFYFAVIPLLFLSSLVLYFFNQPDYIYNGVLVVSFLICTCLLVNYFSKISLHVSLNSYLAVSLTMLSPILSLIWLSVTAIIGWSRIHLNRHKPPEVFLGFIVGILAGFILLNMQNKSGTRVINSLNRDLLIPLVEGEAKALASILSII